MSGNWVSNKYLKIPQAGRREGDRQCEPNVSEEWSTYKINLQQLQF